MTIRVGEAGKRIRFVTNFDMSSAETLQIIAIPPSGEQNQQTWTATLAGALTDLTLEDGTVVSGVPTDQSVYVDITDTSIINEVGNWTLICRMTDTGPTPNDIYVSDPATITVLDDNFDLSAI